MGNFFKSIAVLLSVPLLLSGCNSSATSAENQQSSIRSNLYGRSKLSYEASDILYLRSGP